jgi:hypothetical protein
VSRAYEFSPAWRKRRAQIRKRQEARWASKSSAVTVTKVDPPANDSDVSDLGKGSSPEGDASER